MGPFRSQKGTYSRAKLPPETEEERRKHYKQRKVIPNFNELFLNKEEKTSDPFDVLLEDENAFQETKSRLRSKKPKKPKKPLHVNNSLINSLSNSRISPNDTFDQLFKDAKLPAVDGDNTRRLSSSVGSSLETDGILYQSLLFSGSSPRNEGNGGLFSSDVKQEKRLQHTKKLGLEECTPDKKQVTREVAKKNKTKVRLSHCHNEEEKIPSCTAVKKPIILLHKLPESLSERNKMIVKTNVEVQETICEHEHETKDLPFERLSPKSDLVTSTPADTHRLKSVMKTHRTWSIQPVPALEHTISPVPKESYLVALSNSSNFESPYSFKRRSCGPSNQESGRDSSFESKYETCNSDLKVESSSKTFPKYTSDSNRNELAQSYYNSAVELESGIFKGAIVPARDQNKGGADKKENDELDTSAEIEVSLKKGKVKINNDTESTSNTVTKDMVKCENFNTGSESESPGCTSVLEKNRTNSKIRKSKCSSVRKASKLGSKVSIRKSCAEPSPILTRLRQKAPKQTKNCDTSINDSIVLLNSLRNISSHHSGNEMSLVIGRRRLLSRRKNLTSNRYVHTSDTETSFVIPRKPPKKISQKKRRKSRPSTGSTSHHSVHVSENSFVLSPKIDRRKSTRLYKKNNLELSKVLTFEENKSRTQTKNHSDLKQLDDVSYKSVPDVESTVMSHSSVSSMVLTNFRTRKERRGNQLVYYKQETSTDMFETTEDQHVHVDEDFEDSKINHDSVVIDTGKKQENSALELEDGYDSPKIQCLIPRKTGKGWRRSCLSMATAKLPPHKDETADRRHTLHSGSYGHRRVTGYRISAIPSQINKCIEEMRSEPECEVNSSHHSSFHTVVRTDTEPSTPLDPREHVLSLCSQVEPLPIDECFTESRLINCKKIGEGVYGEVFMTRPNPNNLDNATVLKIMPIEGDFDVNGEPQKKFGEIVSEIVISLELSNLRKSESSNWTENFVNVLHSRCVQGSYMQDLLHLWDVFNEEKGSENDRPDIFPDSQLYIVLEFGHGGGDLESYVFNNAGESLAIFLQIAYSLAVAEQELEFEHRDLHWGNVLVSSTKDTAIDFKVAGATYSLHTKGLKATVIDFTLSRLRLQHCIMFNNLGEDPSLFTAEGDYQFEIYRQMRKANGNDWEKFTPYTNVLWLHYILDKMISECYYKKVKTKVHTSNLTQLKKLKGKMLDYESATDFVFQREMNI